MRLVLFAAVLAVASCERSSAPTPVPSTPVAPAPPGPEPLPPPPDAPTVTGTKVITPADLFAHPEWVGTTVTVDLREELLDDEHSSGAPKHGYDVQVKDLYANRLRLTPAATASAGMTKLGKLTPPLRVTGVLTTNPFGLDLTPSSITQLSFEAPLKLGPATDIMTNPAVHSGMLVEITDDWLTGFEASILGHTAWVGMYGNAKLICAPKFRDTDGMPETRSARVRVVGVVYNLRKYPYGHLGMMHSEIVATEIEWLSPRDPKCAPSP